MDGFAGIKHFQPDIVPLQGLASLLGPRGAAIDNSTCVGDPVVVTLDSGGETEEGEVKVVVCAKDDGEGSAEGEKRVVITRCARIGADDEGEGEEAKYIVIRSTGEEGSEDKIDVIASPQIAVACAGSDDPHKVMVKTIMLDGEGDETLTIPGKVDFALLHDKNVEPGGPWLGVQFGPVPKPLAVHLGLDGEVGQMVGLTKERVRQIQNRALEKLRIAMANRFAAA